MQCGTNRIGIVVLFQFTMYVLVKTFLTLNLLYSFLIESGLTYLMIVFLI